MTTNLKLAQSRVDYWCKKLDLYDWPQIFAEAHRNKQLKKSLQILGHKIPKRSQCILPAKNKNTRQYITAIDDWYPCYRDNKVAISWHEKSKTISVWGDDDFGMFLENTTKKLFDKLVKEGNISKDKCRELGFNND